MFIVDQSTYVQAATRAMLTGKPFEGLVDACRRQAAEEDSAKVVDLADMRRKLRPPGTTDAA
ncbi:MAG: hypothetical protein QOJ86_3051 [Bradyrhizobium sp.]|jgi:hypothetical protein|nr:hypothetical protein [Bradyrhizobium sp.]